MQFLLTQDEYDRLVPKVALDEATVALKRSREMILEAAKYACHHDKPERYGNYCDDCPISLMNEYKTSKLICTLPRNYSK